MTLPDVNQFAQNATTPVINDGDYAPTIKLETPGEYLYGQIADIRLVNTQYGDTYVLEVNDQQRGQVAMWLSNVQLRAGLVEGRNQLGRQVHTGDIVYIRFDGKQPLDGGRTVSNFSINVAANPNTAQQAPQQVQPPAANGAPQQQPYPPPPPQQPAQPQTQAGQQWQQPPPQQWQQPPQQQGQPPQNVPF